ncbi:MAG: 30S ribosomal protein S17 [Vampirovibrionales bacterium]
MPRRFKEGTVISLSGDQTIVVEIVSRKSHNKYSKILTSTTRYQVHDPKSAGKLGSRVKIIESRPISKSKKWVLYDILSEA